MFTGRFAGSFSPVQNSMQIDIGIMSAINATRLCQLMQRGFL
jgi:hypothetical protein